MVEVPLTAGRLVARVCLFIVAAIAMFGGSLQIIPELLIPFIMAGAHYAGS